jgi:SAM-dependent methyltransferase
MYSDVVDLRDFYASSLGQVARRVIRSRIRSLWPDLRGQRLLGLGYAVPYLSLFFDEAERVIAGMPALQGVLPWPPDGRNLTVLADEAELPFQDALFDRVLLIHCLECCESVRPLLKEIWRVLASGGRALIIVPNRSGIWARLDSTPFGTGHPYTIAQLSHLLRDEMFTPVISAGALYVPPLRRRMVLGSAAAWEKLGERWFLPFAGVVVIEAAKQTYIRPAFRKLRLRPAYLPVPQGGVIARTRSFSDLAE